MDPKFQICLARFISDYVRPSIETGIPVLISRRSPITWEEREKLISKWEQEGLVIFDNFCLLPSLNSPEESFITVPEHYARQVFGGKNSAKQLKTIYEKVMRFPKRSRNWPTGSNGMVEEAARSGADFFIESLGEKGDPFRISMTSPITDEVLEAGKQIASLNHKALFGVQLYEDYYPDHGFLHLWAGLILARMASSGRQPNAGLHIGACCGTRHVCLKNPEG